MHILRTQFAFDCILALVLLAFSVLINRLQLLERWENLYYDLEATAISRPVDNNIVIVAIDEHSLDMLGRWPWSRGTHAQLLEQLTSVGVTAVGMDILFMEPDLLQPENDRRLIAAIRDNGHVILPVLTHREHDGLMLSKPLKEFAEAAQLAHVNLIFDSQGIVRQLDLQLETRDEQPLPAMALALSRLLPNHVEPAVADKEDTVLINFAGPPGHFRQVSYGDVLFNATVRQSLHGKVVLIGMTAAGLGSNIATPVSKNSHLMTGIELQANALATVQSGQIIRRVQETLYVLISLVLLVPPVFLFRFVKPGTALLLVLCCLLSTMAVSYVLLNALELWFPLLPTLLCLMLSYPLWSWRRLEQLALLLFKEHENASATLTAIGEAVITTDQKGFIDFMNPAAEKMLSCRLEEAKSKLFTEICQVVDHDDCLALDHQGLSVLQQHKQAQIIRNQKGDEFAVHVSSSPVRSKKGNMAGMVYALRDLTDIVNINRKVAFIASHDSLTGLPNRVLLLDRLGQAITRNNRDNTHFAVLFVNLDAFKKVNDGIGHIGGDLLLQQVSQRLLDRVRKSDTVSRWGGDEFVILSGKLEMPSDAADIAKKIMECLVESFLINEQQVFVSPSIGISWFPEDGRRAEELLTNSDTAMSSARQNGRNNFCFYSQGLENKAKERLLLESELRRAINAGELVMYYQPQIDLLSGRLIGAEALIRWQHPQKGLIGPGHFIPLAEELGLIIPIGQWIIKTVCGQLKSWREQGLPLVKVAINLSANQFMQSDIVQIISTEIDVHDIETELLQVEITESMMIDDIDRVIKILDDLKSAGISIAVDDFGTGYSSLEYLKRFPIDKLKIDKSFVDNVIYDSDDASIVQAVIALGHNMNIQIIAEGVETKEQADFLIQRQCDYGQGYFYSKPIPSKEMELFLRSLDTIEYKKAMI